MAGRRFLLPPSWLAAALLCVAPAAALAQGGSITGAISNYAEVIFPPLTATGVHGLEFGVIIPGATTVTVAPRTAAGGELRITGTRSRKSIDISFVLPPRMTSATGATIPLNFNGNYAALCEISDVTGACVTASYFAWNPVTTPIFRDLPTRYQPGRKTFAHDAYSVYLGGQALPAANQAAGEYAATISVFLIIN